MTPSECQACLQAQSRATSGGAYRMQCLECCARLVRSTHPNRNHAAGMLELIDRAIARFELNWSRESVVARVCQLLAKGAA